MEATRTSPSIGRKRGRSVGFVALLGISLVMWWGSLSDCFRTAASNDAQTYILLVLPISVALTYYDVRKKISADASARWIGWILLCAAILTRIAPWDWLNLLSIEVSLRIFGLVLWWIGIVIVCFGFPRFRSLMFPLCFLFLLVPIPERFLDRIAEWLQHDSAVATTVIFKAARVPVTRDDVMLSIPNLDIEVARECSSIRSSTLLFVATLLLAHLFLRSWWRQGLLVSLALPLSVAKNAVRIFTIAELGTRVDPGFLNGKLHHNGGIVFLGLALVAQIFVLWLLMKSERVPAIRKSN